MPQPFLIASLRVFPSQRSPIPLETDWLPCGYPPTTLNAPSSTLLLPVSPTPTLARSSLAPPKAMGPLFTSRSPLPGRPGRWAANHYGSPTSPTSKLWSPCESVPSATWASPDPTADTLLNFVPSRGPPRTSEPQTRPVPRSWTRTITRRLQRTTPRTATPGAGSTPLKARRTAQWSVPSAVFRPPSRPNRTALRRQLLLPWPSDRTSKLEQPRAFGAS